MSAKNKLLLLFSAIVAFVIGVAMNSARLSDDIDIQAMLNAELLQGDESQSIATISNSLGQLTLVNFWASWCPPCKDEMPIFETMYRQFKGDESNAFVIIGVAIDSPDKAQPLLDSMDITYPILYAEQTGMQIMETAGNPQGLMPYSLLLNEEGKIVDRVLGKIDEQQITTWIEQYLHSKS